MRHAIDRGAFSPLLAVFGATRDNSHVTVTDGDVTVRFGLSHHRIERAHIERAERASWPLLGGIGWRVGRNVLGLIGSLRGIVKLELSQPYEHRVIGYPMKFTQLYLSMEDPDAFLADLHDAR